MTTQTTAQTTTEKPKSIKEKMKELKAQEAALKAAAAKEKTERVEAETKEAQELMEDLNSLGKMTVVVGDHTLTLEEALISGKATTIMVQDKNTGEKKERAHMMFMESARVKSLQKAIKRIKLIAADLEVRPKANPVEEKAAA